MLTEILVCLSYDEVLEYRVSGKQFVWIEESHYDELQKRKLFMSVGCDRAGDSYDVEIKIERIDNEKVIDVMLKVGPEMFNTFRIHKKIIKYRDYPTWYEHPKPVKEMTPVPDIVSKIMNGF
jgi:hypothetical protein